MNTDTSNCLIFCGVFLACLLFLSWFVKGRIEFRATRRFRFPPRGVDRNVADLSADERMLREEEMSRRERSNAELRRKLEALEEGKGERERETEQEEKWKNW